MKIFVVSFTKRERSVLSKLIQKMKDNNLYTNDYEDADYVLAVGDRIEVFNFVLERFKENKKIIHLWAGECDSGWSTHDEVYRNAMTLMADYHLCTNPEARDRVKALCKSVNKIYRIFVVGNVMLDNLDDINEKKFMEVLDKFNLKEEKYDLILYNPPTRLSRNEITRDIKKILSIIERPFVWLTPNGDKYSDMIMKYVNTHTLPRDEFLNLLKNCRKFITNSSSQYYEAPFFLEKEQIIQIGLRNKNRESRYSNMSILNASDNIIKFFKMLECHK